MADSPVFIHSLFRSGSTYLFHVFNRAEEQDYFCFQEPLNEVVMYSKDDPDGLLNFESNAEAVEALHHPHLKDGYFHELVETKDAWPAFANTAICYEEAFRQDELAATIPFLKSLIEASPQRPVFQACRSVFRSEGLKTHIGGKHIFLWRNPLDQWWSYKSTEYFEIGMQLFLLATPRPLVLDKVAEAIGFTMPPNRAPLAASDFLRGRPLSSDDNYRLFYTLWSLAMLHGRQSADVSINIDKLSTDKAYRESTLKALKDLGIDGVNFDDCKIPKRYFYSEEIEHKESLEAEVNSWFEMGGYHPDSLFAIQALRREYAPNRSTATSTSKTHEKELRRSRIIIERLEQQKVGLSEIASKSYEEDLLNKQHALSQAQATITQLENQTETLSAEKNKLTAENTELTAENANIPNLVFDLERTHEQLSAQQERLLAKEIAHTEALQLAHLRQIEIDRLNNENRSLIASSSWRITRPLRVFTRTSRKIATPPLRLLLSGLLRMVRSLPWLKALILKVSSVSPPIKNKLEHFASVRPKSDQTISHLNGAHPSTPMRQHPDIMDGAPASPGLEKSRTH